MRSVVGSLPGTSFKGAFMLQKSMSCQRECWRISYLIDLTGNSGAHQEYSCSFYTDLFDVLVDLFDTLVVMNMDDQGLSSQTDEIGCIMYT